MLAVAKDMPWAWCSLALETSTSTPTSYAEGAIPRGLLSPDKSDRSNLEAHPGVRGTEFPTVLERGARGNPWSDRAQRYLPVVRRIASRESCSGRSLWL